MSDLLKLFNSLNSYCEAITFDEIDIIFDKLIDTGESSVGNRLAVKSNVCRNGNLQSFPLLSIITKDNVVLSVILEIATTIRHIRQSDIGYENAYDCWDKIIEVSPRENYLALIYIILRLGNYYPNVEKYRKISIATASTYFLSLTIPGCKGFHIFDERVISRSLKVFNLIEYVQSEYSLCPDERTEFWVNIVNFANDLKLVFRYVHFDECKLERNLIIWELLKILYNNNVNGLLNNYAADLHNSCYDIFDEVINSHNGDPEETLMKLMKMSLNLHTHNALAKINTSNSNYTPHSHICRHISDWFVHTISKYPMILSKVLSFYIKYVIVNPEKSWRAEQHQRALDYAANYDAHLYSKCNVSILPFLLQTLRAEDILVRQNAVDLCNRLIKIDSTVNWELFRHEVSKIPREVYALKELIIRLEDTNSVIKLKALHGLNEGFINGSILTRKILSEGVRYATFDINNVFLPIEPPISKKEVRYAKPKPLNPDFTYEGHQIIQPYFNKLPEMIYGLWKSQIGYVRKAAIVLIEPIVTLNPLVIYNTNFVKYCLSLSHDPISFVRRQALKMIDQQLATYPNCFPIICAWCRILIPMLEDNDTRNIDVATERRVFDNIRGIDQSNKPEHFMPWIIIRVLLTMENRQHFQASLQSAIKKQDINPNILGYVKSHIHTSNSTEAWVILNFAAGKVKCNEPDCLVFNFVKSMQEKSWNAAQNLQMILEVLSKYVKDFSHSALNMAFSCVVNLIKDGCIPPTIVGKAFDLCLSINNHSLCIDETESVGTDNSKKTVLLWLENIQTICENYLLNNLTNFYSNKSKCMSYMFSYSESNVESSKKPNKLIISFMLNCIKQYLKIAEAEFDPEDINILNQLIILSARFALRDSNLASKSCYLYNLILQNIDRPQIIKTVLAAFTDLCKRHTQTVELALNNILLKMKSPYLINRIETFKNISSLVLQDHLKLRANILLSLMTVMLDENRELSNSATEFFYTYVEKKNIILFQTCLLECPFVYNEYLNFEGLENFSSVENHSPLKGPEKIKDRRTLYNVFLNGVDELGLIMYFDILKLIYVKIQKDSLIKSDEGFATIKDILFILKRVCDMIPSKTEYNEHGIADGHSISAIEVSVKKKSERSINSKYLTTINKAFTVLEKSISLIPKISKLLLELDRSFEQPLYKLNSAICLKFGKYIEFAQPAEFWNNYKIVPKDSFYNKKRKTTLSNEN